MTIMSSLLSCNIIEKDKSGETLWVWTFPCITNEQKDYIIKKCSINELKTSLYGKFKKNWFYIHISECNPNVIENVEQFGIIIWTKDFKPDLYLRLTSMLCNAYSESGDPTKVLHLYLSIATKDVSPNNNGSLLFKEFCTQHPHKSSRLKELIKMFGLEIILVYNALLLKKKLVVYHHSLPILLEWLKSFPYFVAHRKFEDNFIPWFELNETDIGSLMEKTNYIAGCCDNSVFLRADLYDVLVNLAAKEITIAPHSKDKLTMTKVHKEIALFMEQLGNGDFEEEKILSAISTKTKELINLIGSMAETTEDGQNVIAVEKIKERNLSLAMENFIVQLASTENIYLSNN